MKNWLKPIVCTGILVSSTTMIDAAARASEYTMENNSRMTEFKEIKQISLGSIVPPTFVGGFYLAKMPPTMKDLIRTIVVGTANYNSETLGLRYIEIPTKVALLSVEELSKWKLKISTRTQTIATTKEGDAITTKFEVTVKSEFYNENNELKGTSEQCYLYAKVKYENEIGIKYELMNSMRLG
ncbi:hypothetical protein [Bacillus cereus]|uniref:hypothetical protein n=1 Tax=Bacillus cereus TaxID=1396 RepID=UPI0018CFCB5B|nr:hypothetical protein [Bacillus cereus]MBG9618032.1 hypothetical protein [Bacillus cereus]